MAARASMAGLITRLRRMIGDTAGASQVFDDDELQDALDVYQTEHRYERLDALETIQAGGQRVYYDFWAADEVGDWEADEVLTDGSYNVLPATTGETVNYTVDRLQGQWHFAEPLSSLLVRITGRTYDLHGAAADKCRDWAAKVKLEFDIRTNQRQYSRSQQFKMLLEMADRYDAKRLPMNATMVRTDIATAAIRSNG